MRKLSEKKGMFKKRIEEEILDETSDLVYFDESKRDDDPKQDILNVLAETKHTFPVHPTFKIPFSKEGSEKIRQWFVENFGDSE